MRLPRLAPPRATAFAWHCSLPLPPPFPPSAAPQAPQTTRCPTRFLIAAWHFPICIASFAPHGCARRFFIPLFSLALLDSQVTTSTAASAPACRGPRGTTHSQHAPLPPPVSVFLRTSAPLAFALAALFLYGSPSPSPSARRHCCNLGFGGRHRHAVGAGGMRTEGQGVGFSHTTPHGDGSLFLKDKAPRKVRAVP